MMMYSLANKGFWVAFTNLNLLYKDDYLNQNTTAEQSFTELTVQKAVTPETVTPPDKPVYMLKRIGTTTYRISVHLSKTSKETMGDKISRMIKNETLGKAANL